MTKRYLSDTLFFGNITFCRFTAPPEPTLPDAARRLALAAPMQVHAAELRLITCNRSAAPETMAHHGRVTLRG